MIKSFPNVGQTLGKNGWFWLCRTFISNFSFDRLQSWSNFGSFCMFWQLWKIINQCNWVLRINWDVFYQNWWQNDPIRTVSLVKNFFSSHVFAYLSMNPISFLPQTAHFLQGTCTFSTISDLLIPMGLPNFNIRSGTIFLLVSLGINWPQLTVRNDWLSRSRTLSAKVVELHYAASQPIWDVKK